ncbi:ImmA/IrrE family metallo-endopeptidase [Microbacterium sp. NPDC055665]
MVEIASAAAGRPVRAVQREETYDNYGSAFTYNFPDRSVIVVRESDHSFYQLWGLFHEVGHLIFGHRCSALSALYRSPNAEDDDWRQFVRRNRHAHFGKGFQELEAEALALLVGRHLLKSRWRRDEVVFG